MNMSGGSTQISSLMALGAMYPVISPAPGLGRQVPFGASLVAQGTESPTATGYTLGDDLDALPPGWDMTGGPQMARLFATDAGRQILAGPRLLPDEVRRIESFVERQHAGDTVELALQGDILEYPDIVATVTKSRREILIAVKPGTREYVFLMGGERSVHADVLPAGYETVGHTHPYSESKSVRAEAVHPSGGDIENFLLREADEEFVLTDMGVFYYRNIQKDRTLAGLADVSAPNSFATYAGVMCKSMSEDYNNARRFADMAFGIEMEFVPFTEDGRGYLDSSSDALLVNMIKAGFYGRDGNSFYGEIHTHLLEFFGPDEIAAAIEKYGLQSFICGKFAETPRKQVASVRNSILNKIDQFLTRLFFDSELVKGAYRQTLLGRYSERLQQSRLDLQGVTPQSEDIRKLYVEYLDELFEAQLVLMNLFEMRLKLEIYEIHERFERDDPLGHTLFDGNKRATARQFLAKDANKYARYDRVLEPYLLSQQKADRFFREADPTKLGEMAFAGIAQMVDRYPLDEQGWSDVEASYLAKWVYPDAEGRTTNDPIKHDLYRRLFVEGASAEILAEHGDNPSPKSRLYAATAHLYEGRLEEAKAEVRRGLETMLGESLDDAAAPEVYDTPLIGANPAEQPAQASPV